MKVDIYRQTTDPMVAVAVQHGTDIQSVEIPELDGEVLEFWKTRYLGTDPPLTSFNDEDCARDVAARGYHLSIGNIRANQPVDDDDDLDILE